MTILVGCGLGGTSLINGGVALRPDARVLADERWPAPLRVPHALDESYAHALTMLAATPVPDRVAELPRLRALEAAADAIGATFARPH